MGNTPSYRELKHFPAVAILAVFVVGSSCTSASPPQGSRESVEWPSYAGGNGSLRYSPAGDITPENVRFLKRVWTWRTGEFGRLDKVTWGTIDPWVFEATPVMLSDTLYVVTPLNQVAALDARTGSEFWRFDPDATRWGPNGNNHSGFVHRGVAIWSGIGKRRVFLNSRWKLFALDATTGKPDPGFGIEGTVDLTTHLRWPVDRLEFGSTSPPVIWGDIVIVGSQVSDALVHDRDPPGDVQAFNVHTGEFLWRWEPVPPVGTPDRNTWSGESGAVTGHVNVWAPISVDSARGLLFLPVSAPSNDWYGGNRLGDNLYAESLVCLDAATGRLVWYQQLVHHGIWDYDLSGPPILATIRDSTQSSEVVIVAGKTGYLYVFDRLSGKPRWPIEERSVPPSRVPGEVTSPTQPTPVWPEPFARQGFDESQLVDWTQEISNAARAKVANFKLGPIFTPATLEGTVVMPGWIGGAGWGAAAFDPVRQLLVIKATNLPSLVKLVAKDGVSGFVGKVGAAGTDTGLTIHLPRWRAWYGRWQEGVDVPVSKPPYGTLAAIDLTSGKRSWQVTIGDMPAIRHHPLLRELHLPPLGVGGAPGPLLTASGLAFLTGGGNTFYSIDVQTGGTLWSVPLGQVGYSNPMTYRAGDGRQYVVIATGKGAGTALQAFALPKH